jgi:hypothetical protein
VANSTSISISVGRLVAHGTGYFESSPSSPQYIKTGEHNIRKPLQVFAHQEMIVDWFDFWLNDHEALTGKEEQYPRLRLLKKNRDHLRIAPGADGH